MLMHIPRSFSPELLALMAAMGHGEILSRLGIKAAIGLVERFAFYDRAAGPWES